MSDLIAGRELDIQVAGRVMGWGSIDLEDDGDYWGTYIPSSERNRSLQPGEVPGWRETVPHYSTDRNDAEKVVQALVEIGWQIIIEPIETDNSGRQRVYAKKSGEQSKSNMIVDSQADALPLAICTVALDVIELEEKDRLQSRSDSGGGEA